MHEREGFQVLSMLKLDEATRTIPLLTCLSEYDIPSTRAAFIARDDDEQMPGAVPAASMN